MSYCKWCNHEIGHEEGCPEAPAARQRREEFDAAQVVWVCEEGHVDDHHLSIPGVEERCSRCGGKCEGFKSLDFLARALIDARSTPPVSESPGNSGEGDQRVVFEFHPECLEGENVREFHPEIVGAATGALRTMLDPEKDARAHRDADVLASCAVSEALKALVAVANLTRGGQKFTMKPGTHGGAAEGRWPANVVLDEEAAAELDGQTGTVREGQVSNDTHGDSGGASRFFYCAKTSRGERNAGLEGFAAKTINWSSGEESPGTFQSDGTEREQRNHHPTVKPINLMRWLVRLVTPPGGTVLDPFLGSGSTGCATVLEGFDFLGIEREPEYVAIAEARIAFWTQHEGRELEDVLRIAGRSQRESKRHEETGQGSLLALAATSTQHEETP